MSAPLLDVTSLSKRYGRHVGCADISFDLWPGEVMGIVGESGSGKSTLLNCLAGHLSLPAHIGRHGVADAVACLLHVRAEFHRCILRGLNFRDRRIATSQAEQQPSAQQQAYSQFTSLNRWLDVSIQAGGIHPGSWV